MQMPTQSQVVRPTGLQPSARGVGVAIADDPEARDAVCGAPPTHDPCARVGRGSFAEFLRLANERVPLGLELVDGCGPREGEGNLIAVLRKVGGTPDTSA